MGARGLMRSTTQLGDIYRAMRRALQIASAVVIVAACASVNARAQGSPLQLRPSQPATEQDVSKERSVTLEERTENLGRLYKNDQNDTLQELWFLGRYQGQYHWTEASTGDSDYYETRRFRLGA